MILVTGGNGFLGSYLVKYLVNKGEEVTVLVRPASNLSLLGHYRNKVRLLKGDVLDVISLNDAMQGVRKVYHTAAAVSFSSGHSARILKTNVEGTANVVNTALECKVEKLVHVSSIAALGHPDTPVNGTAMMNENVKWDSANAFSDYSLSKFLAEKEIWRGSAEGLNVVIGSPSVIIGAGFWDTGTGKIFKTIKKGFPFYTYGTNGFVDVRDVARALIMLMESNISRERFIISGENLTYKNLLFSVAAAVNARKPRLPLTPLMMKALWPAEWVRSYLVGKEPLITRELAHLSNKDFRYDNSKLVDATGIKFHPIAETITETAESLKVTLSHGKSFGVLEI